MLWYKASNSNDVQPAEVDTTSSETTIFVRKDFVLIPEKTEGDQVTPAHYEYQEAKMSPVEFELYEDNQALKDYLDMIAEV